MDKLVTRRGFMVLTAGAVAHARLEAQTQSAHVSVTELDHIDILKQAKAALSQPVSAPASPDFHSEIEPNLSTAGVASHSRLQRTDATALQNFSATVAALAAGSLLTHDELYAQQAVAHLQPWLVTPETRLKPAFDGAGCAAGTLNPTPAGIVDLVPLAELARSLSFLTDSLPPEQFGVLQAWFTAVGQWLDTNKQAFIARESKDHRASAHLLLTAAIARLLRDEVTLEACRKRFRAHTLRNQVRADGVFPQEVATPNPYRNTLFNFDLLGGACQLLSSQFDLLWDYELIDDIGMRILAAYLYPVIAHPEHWGFPADAHSFRDLPGRRPALLFSGRAYGRPEYIDAWLNQPATLPEAISDTFPIRQPSLWTARAPHGF